MWRITAGGNWKFSAATAYLSLQYFKNADALGTASYSALKDNGIGSITSTQMKKLDGLEGENIILGFSTPVMGGKVLGAVGYIHAKTDELSKKLKADGGFIALGYQYPFSKTTRLYSAIGASAAKYKSGDQSVKPRGFYGTLGLSHYF